jgi:Cu/Zn superoxide dismutase
VSNLHAFERFHMGIALLALSGLFKNLQSFTTSTHSQALPKRPAVRLHPEWAVRSTPCAQPSHSKTQVSQRRPSLRVVHVHESGQCSAGAGRMVISGRMADVCAELDRLVAMEARRRPA